MSYPTNKYKKLLKNIKNTEEAMQLLIDFYNKCKNIDIIANTFDSTPEIIIGYLKKLDIFQKKFCNKCQIWKNLNQFSKDASRPEGLKGQCVECCRNSIKNWSIENKDHRKQYSDEYISKNKDNLKIKQKQWYENTKEIRQKNSLEYYYKNRETKSLYQKKRFQNEIHRNSRRLWQNRYNKEVFTQRFRHNFSIRINQILKKSNTSKLGNSISQYLEYTFDELVEHLKTTFLPGMTLENHGIYGWHIDHKIPISAFNITSMDCLEFKACWSLHNLQALWWNDNLKKSDSYDLSDKQKLLELVNKI